MAKLTDSTINGYLNVSSKIQIQSTHVYTEEYKPTIEELNASLITISDTCPNKGLWFKKIEIVQNNGNIDWKYNHSHNQYALINHVHDYSNINHNHDSLFAKLTHNHNSIYSLISHLHNEYSLIDHNHNDENKYSLINHTHDSENFALLDHSHGFMGVETIARGNVLPVGGANNTIWIKYQ